MEPRETPGWRDGKNGVSQDPESFQAEQAKATWEETDEL